MKKKYRLEQDQKPVLGDTQKPEHVIIEGDNIYVLDYLSSPNEVTDGKETIDIIYIDPPYNTGNKFVYNDKWGSDEWKNFMRDRLVLAKPLLKNDGIIYISIGHQELVNLTSLCDEIFGRNNRITLMSRITKKGGHQGKHFAESCDYVLMYAKDISLINKIGLRSDDGYYEKPLQMNSYTAVSNAGRYWIKCPDGTLVLPQGDSHPPEKEYSSISNHPHEGQWLCSIDSYKKKLENGNIVFKESNTSKLIHSFAPGKSTKWAVYYKNKRPPYTKLPNYLVGNEFLNRKGSEEIKVHFGGRKVFDYPKPLALMKHLIQITNKPEDITVLDFFAGSGSTGEAVISLNAEEDKKMRVILCAMNDSTDRVEEICSKITFERMKSVTQKAIDEAKDLGITISNGFPPSLVSYKLINQ